MNDHIARIWERVEALRPMIEAHREEGDTLHHLPDAVGQASGKPMFTACYSLSSTVAKISTR
jgi:hypothetical protein